MTKPNDNIIEMAREDSRIDEDKLDILRAKVIEVHDLEEEISDLEDRTRLKKEQVRELRERILPDIFDEAKVTAVSVAAKGNMAAFTAKLVPFYKANIPATSANEAYKWLEKKGHGDLIKSTITIEFARGELDTAHKIEKLLREMKIDFSVKLTVHWKTLTAFVQEQIERHQTTPPLDLLGATVGRVVNIKEDKK